MLLDKYGPTPLDVAEALLEGRINVWHEFVDDVVTPMILEAAKHRLAARQPSTNITPRSDAIDATCQPVLGSPAKLLTKN